MKTATLPIITILTIIIAITIIFLIQNLNNDQIVCTEEAKLCPDATSVVREGPDCEFAPCPNEGKEVYCTTEQREAKSCITLYNPVCGWPDPEKIQCITYPCATTYSNYCFACQNKDVFYFTEGECPIIEEKIYCYPPEFNEGGCSAVYQPVCGVSTFCVEGPTCATTFSNSCIACKNSEVEYYIKGECPTS